MAKLNLPKLNKDSQDDSKSSGNEYGINLPKIKLDPYAKTEFQDNRYFDSQYDKGSFSDMNLKERRGQSQTAGDKFVNGLIQASGKALSSLEKGTAGTIYGVGAVLSSINSDKGVQFSKLYDNIITRGMDEMEAKISGSTPLYSTQEYESLPWYKKLTKANLWYGDVLSGVGYTAGSLATGYGANAAFRNLAKGLGVTGKTTNALNQLTVATLSAGAEAGDEARQTKNEFISKTLANRKAYYQSIGQEIPQEEIDRINSLGTELGNSVFLINLPIVAGSNFLQFGKTMTNFNAEKRAIGELAKEVENKIERKAVGDQFTKIQLSPLEEKLAKIIKIGKQPVEEGTQEQIQLATSKGSLDFYGKKFKGDKTNVFESALEGFKEAYGTDEGWTNFIVGGLSAGISGAATPNSELRQAFGNNDENINTALEVLNKHNPKSVYKELIQADNRAKVISESMTEAVANNDKFEFNNAQNDLLTNYVLSRLKTGQFESLKEDLNAFKTASPEEFESLFGIKAEESNKNSVSELVQERINKIEDIKKAYESVNNRFPDFSEGLKERLTHASFSIDDASSRKHKLYQDLMNITMKENSGLLVKFGENIMSNLPGSEKYTPIQINNEFKKELTKLNPLRQPEVNEIVKDIEKLNSREEEYRNLFNKIVNDESLREKLNKQDENLDKKTSKSTANNDETNEKNLNTSIKAGDEIQFKGESTSQIVESIDEENGIIFIKGDENPHHKEEFYIPAKLSSTGAEVLNNTDITLPYTGERNDGAGIHKKGTKERISKILNNTDNIENNIRIKLSKKVSVEGNIQRGKKHFLSINPKEDKATLSPNMDLDVIYEMKDGEEWFDAFHGPHSGQYVVVDSKGNTKPFYFTEKNKNKAKELFKIKNSDGSIRDLNDEDLNKLIQNQAKVDAINNVLRDIYNKNGEITISAKELKNKYGIDIFTKKGSFDTIDEDDQKPILSDITKANIDGKYYIFSAENASNVEGLTLLGELSNLSKAEDLLSSIDNANNFISISKSRYMAIGRELNGKTFLFSIDTPLFTNDDLFPILSDILDKESIDAKEKNKINDDLNKLIHIISPKGTRVEFKIDTNKEGQITKLQLVENKNNKKTYYDIPLAKNTSLASIVKNANKEGLSYIKETSFRKSIPKASDTRNIANDELASMFISNVGPNIFNYSKVEVDISLPKNESKQTLKEEVKEEPSISKEKDINAPEGEIEARIALLEKQAEEEGDFEKQIALLEERDALIVKLLTGKDIIDDTDRITNKLSDKKANILIDIPQAEENIRNMITPDDVISFDDINEILSNIENKGETWGFFKDKVIYLSNKAEKGTEFHEVFHYVFRRLLSDSEINRIYTIAKIMYKAPTMEQLKELKLSSTANKNLSLEELRQLYYEEKMANSFVDWKQKQANLAKLGIIGKLIKKIQGLINWIKKNNTELESLFESINKGSYKNSDVVINNRFSNYNSPVFKLLINGEKLIEGGKTYTYASLEEGKQIVRTLTGRIVKELSNSKLDRDTIIDNVINSEYKNNEISKNKNLLESFSSKERIKIFEKLKQYQFIYSNPEAVSVLKDQINKLLDTFNFSSEEMDLDDQITNEENERKSIDFDKNAINIGGFDSLNKEIRAYIGTTLVTVEDVLGRNTEVAVDPQVVYQGIERILASTSPGEMMNKLKVFSEYNPQTKAVYDRLVSDTGYDETLGIAKINPQLLQQFLNSFTKEKLNYLQILFNPESGEVKVINANTKDAKHVQFSQWYRNYNSIKDVNSEENINKLSKAAQYLASGDINKENSIRIAFKGIGIDLSEAYVKFSLLSNSDIQNPLVKLNSDIYSIKEEDINQIIKTLKSKKSPFEELEKGEGNIGRILKIADANANFDENISSSNFQDSKGKTRWSYISPSLALERTRELESILSTKEGRESFIEQLKTKYSHDYSFNDNNYLINHPQADELFSNFHLDFTGDIRQEEAGKEGTTFKSIDDRSFKLVQYSLFAKQSKRGELTLARFYPKVLEASASAYSIELPVEEFYKKAPTEKAINTLYNQFLQEVKRISITQKELENPNIQKIKDYHVGKQNGFKLFYFRFLENTDLGKQILEKAVSYNSREDFNDLESKIKDELLKFVNLEIEQEIKLLSDLGILDKDQNLLPKEFRNSPEQHIGNFYLNSLVNLNAYNDLIELNPAFSKHSVDNVKRAKRLIASKVSFGKGQHIVGFIKEPTAEGLTKKIDIADAQSYIDINHFKFILLREGKLSSEINNILNKINDGEELSWDEITLLKDKQVMLNSIKTVTSGPVDYHKMSDFILTKKLTSIKDEDGIWQPKPGREYLHHLREQLENLSRKATQDKFKNTGKRFDWNQNMTIEQIDQIVPARIIPESASKLLTPIPANLIDGKYTFDKTNTRYVENKYSGRQVDTPSGKTEIVYGTQLIQLIDSEQDDNTIVNFKGEDVKIGELRKIYQKLLSQARTNSVENAKKFLGKLVDGKLTEKEESKFRKKLLDTLEESGADDSLLQFFGLDPKYNLNLPNTLNKYEQLFLAHFSKGVLGQKIAGLKLTLVSGNGFNIHDKQTNSYRELKYNPSGLSEVALPAFTKELHNLKEGDIVKYEDILSMFGQRIPTQDKHSMIAFKVVEFLPSEYGSIGIFPKEVVELSGADFDIDSIFVERKDFYVKNGKLIPFGSAITIEDKKEEYIQDQLQNNKDLKKLIKFNKGNIQQAFKDLQLPYSLEEYKKASNDGKIELSNTVINNQLVDTNILFLTNEKMVKEGIPQTPATTDRLSSVRDKILELQGKNKENQFTLNSPIGQYQAWKSNSTGKENVGPAANANLIRAFLYKAKVHLQKNTFKPEFNGKQYFDFSKNRDSEKNRIQDTLSTILSSMTDNAKDPMAGDLNLSLTSLGPALQLVSLGVDLYDVMLFINNPLVKEYTKTVENIKTAVKSKKDQKIKKDNIKQDIISKYKLSPSEDLNLNTKELEKNIIENNSNNIKALEVFLNLEKQGVYWQHLSKILALNKGLPSSFEDMENIKSAIKAFKIGEKEGLSDEAPFDVRNALHGTHIMNNIKLFNEILDVSEQYFITQTPIFKELIDNISSAIRENISNKNEVFSNIKKDFLSYISINAYKHDLNRPLNQSLLNGENNITVQLKNLIKENPELKDNKLIRFLSIDNSKNIPILIANTRIKLTGNQIEELTDSFRELFNSPETNQFAKNLYEYLIIKDNLQFKNDSFIKFISPFMFKKMSDKLDNIGEILYTSRNTKDITGYSAVELINNFKDIWIRYIGNQQYIEKSYSLQDSLKEESPKEYIIFNKSLYKLNKEKNFYEKSSSIGNDIQSPYGFSTAKDVINNNNLEIQKQIKSEELVPESMEIISPILEDLKSRFNLDYEVVNEPNVDWVGQYRNINGINKVVINSAKVQLDTPFHEFAHPFIRVVRETNKPLWNNLIVELERDEVGKKVLKETIKNYPELSLVNQKEEAIVTAIGLYATENLIKEKNKNLIEKLLELFNKIVELISSTINPSELPKMKLRELGKLMSSKTKIDITKAKNLIAKNEISNQKENNKIDQSSAFLKQQIFFKRRLNRLEKQLKSLNGNTKEYNDILSEIEETSAKLSTITPENEHQVLLELGESTLNKAEDFISELEEGTAIDKAKSLEYTSDVLETFSDFEELESRTKKLYKRYFKFASNHNLNNINEYYTGDEKLSRKDIDKQNEDISTIRKSVGALSDLSNHIARTIGSIIKSAQNRISTLNKQSSKEIQEKIDGLDKWAKNNGMKLSDVYEMFIQEEKGTYVLAKEYTSEFYNDLYKAFSKLKDESTKQEGREWLKNNTIKTEEGWKTNLEKYQNKNYKKIQSNPELKEFYNYYQHKIQEASNNLSIKLNKNFIPNIKKDSIKDKIKGLNPFKDIKTGNFVGREEEFADALPLQYNKPMDIKDKSTNLGSSLLQFVMYSNNYAEMTKILPEVRLLQDELAYKVHTNGDVIHRFFTKSSNPNVEIKGEDTNLYKMVEDVINMQIKGKMKKEEGKYKVSDLYDENGEKIGEKIIDVTSVLDNGIKYNSLLRIGFSPITAITNWLFGDISNIIEAVGGQFFGVKDLYNASNIFFKQNFNKDSNLNKLLEKLNPLQELDDYDYVENIKLTGSNKKMSLEKLEEYMYYPQKAGEKFLQSRTMLAIMIKEGLITSKGELTDKYNKLSEKELSQLSDKIQRVNQMIHGRYSQKEAATLQQSVLYRLASQFRKWIPAAIENRIGTKQWDNRLQVVTEGRYRTIGKLILNLRDTIDRAKSGNLTDLEVYNIKKQLSEIIILTATMLLYAGIKGGDDDKKRMKNPFVKLGLTILDRASGDLEYFYNPKSGVEIAKNAVPLAKTAGDILKAIEYLPYALYIGDSQYKRGSNKGMNKFYVTISKVTPGIKVINDVRRIVNSQELEELK